MNVRVRDYHLDGYGRVDNTRYPESLGETRWASFEQHDLLSVLKGITLVVAYTDIRYRRSAVKGDESRSEGRLKEMTSRHIALTQIIILPNGKNAVEAEVTMMAVNAADGRSINVPAPLSTALKIITVK